MTTIDELFIHEIDTLVKFRKLGMDECQMFALEHEEDELPNYKRAVLEHIVFNLKSEVVPALRKKKQPQREEILDSLYRASVMINPTVHYQAWTQIRRMEVDAIVGSVAKAEPAPRRRRAKKTTPIPMTKFLGLERHLEEQVVGQPEAIRQVVDSFKLYQAGLQDKERPIGVFLYAGPSGVGKTHLAQALHKYLFDAKTEMIRIDCGEFQQKHENQKLAGSPPGYINSDEGGYLTNTLRENPQTVILIDEIEKAHPDLTNTFLRMFDEGVISDNKGELVSCHQAVIIITTNLGNDRTVADSMGRGAGFNKALYTGVEGSQTPSRQTVVRNVETHMRDFFKPEVLNRVDDVVIFNHLTKADYEKIAELQLEIVQEKLAERGFSIAYDADVVANMVNSGMNAVEGARRLRKIRRNVIENKLADIILKKPHPRGTVFQIAPEEESFKIVALAPTKSKAE